MKTTLAVDTKYARVESGALEIAETLARGSFQSGLLYGREALSLATLAGKAKKYSGHYARSRDAFIARLKSDDRISVSEEIGDHNRRELVIQLASIRPMTITEIKTSIKARQSLGEANTSMKEAA